MGIVDFNDVVKLIVNYRIKLINFIGK